MNFIVGVDEAGRGPLAGPVTVAVFGAEKKMEKWLLRNIFDNKLRDSKKLSSKKREEIYKELKELCHKNKTNKGAPCWFAVSHISNKIIDKKGISFAIKKGIKKCLKKINLTPNPSPRSRRGEKNKNPKLKILLDGSLKAPGEYKNQKTIIKGDEKNVFIACASIVAKVSRDRLMCRLASKYPAYGLEIHKGYGTRLHYKLLKKHGICDLHRKSFCRNFLNGSNSWKRAVDII